MKSLKNKTNTGPNDNTKSILEDAFLYNEVDLALSGNSSSAFDYIRGVLLDIDNLYFYIGDTKNGISIAVKRKEVIVIKLYDPDSEMPLQGDDPSERGDLN